MTERDKILCGFRACSQKQAIYNPEEYLGLKLIEEISAHHGNKAGNDKKMKVHNFIEVLKPCGGRYSPDGQHQHTKKE